MDTENNLTAYISLFALAAEKLRATFAAHFVQCRIFFLSHLNFLTLILPQ